MNCFSDIIIIRRIVAMKKTFTLLLAFLMLLSVFGCAAPAVPAESEEAAVPAESEEVAAPAEEAKDAEGAVIGVVVKVENSHFLAMFQGARDAAAEYGATIVEATPLNDTDYTGQLTKVEDMISQGVDGIVASPLSDTLLLDAFDSYIANGGYVALADTDMPNWDGKLAFVGTDNYQAVYESAMYLKDYLEPGDNVIVFRGPQGNSTHEDRAAGALAGLEELGVNILEVYDAECATDKAAAAMEDFMVKYADVGIDCVFTTSGEMVIGAVEAADQAGLTDVIFTGFNGAIEEIDLVAADKVLYTVAQNPYLMGYSCTKAILAEMNGEEYDYEQNSGVTFITKDNYQEYLESSGQ